MKGAARTYFHQDHLTSSTAMTDATGAITETTEYMPFGHERGHTGAWVTNYKYTDQELDIETGLYNYDARHYDPVIGRFISADAIVQNYYDPQMLNRYSYCRNNPLVLKDPDGRVTIKIPFTKTYFYFQQKTGGGYRIGFTTREEGRYINPAPGGLTNQMFGRQRITLNNDVPGGLTTDQRVRFEAADLVEGAVLQTDFNININSTTGGHTTGQHPLGEAGDINRINDQRVVDPAARENVTTLQQALGDQPEIFRNYGPTQQTETHIRNSERTDFPVPLQAPAHRDHIHYSVPTSQESQLRQAPINQGQANDQRRRPRGN